MSYLVSFIVVADEAAFVPQLVGMAETFLGAPGTVVRREHGGFDRAGRSGVAEERLVMVELTTPGGAADLARARSLEGVLRRTLTASGAKQSAVSVYVRSA